MHLTARRFQTPHPRNSAPRLCQIKIPLLADMALTDGQPVSAMYIVGLLDRAAAGCTFCSWKNSYVHEAASLIDTLANQGCTLDI